MDGAHHLLHFSRVLSCLASSHLGVSLNSPFVNDTTTNQRQDGWRQGRKGLWKSEAEGGVPERQGRPPVPRGQDPPSPQEPCLLLRPCWSHRGRLQLRHPGVPDR